jgi:hypothetical protein
VTQSRETRLLVRDFRKQAKDLSMLLERFLQSLYGFRPGLYIRFSRWWWQRSNSTFIHDTDRFFGEDYWPIILWAKANEYLEDGGKDAYPKTTATEDALLRDAARRDQCPGPIRDAVEQFRLQNETATDWLSTPQGQQWGNKVFRPLLKGSSRLRDIISADDLPQEVALTVQEVDQRPWLSWPIGKKWESQSLDRSEQTLRRIFGAYIARKYRSNTATSRRTDYVPTPPDLPDSSAERDFQEAEARLDLDALMRSLPPKQREAAEMALGAQRVGVSLEEMARRQGKDPGRARENYKAIQRKFSR